MKTAQDVASHLLKELPAPHGLIAAEQFLDTGNISSIRSQDTFGFLTAMDWTISRLFPILASNWYFAHLAKASLLGVVGIQTLEGPTEEDVRAALFEAFKRNIIKHLPHDAALALEPYLSKNTITEEAVRDMTTSVLKFDIYGQPDLTLLWCCRWSTLPREMGEWMDKAHTAMGAGSPLPPFPSQEAVKTPNYVVSPSPRAPKEGCSRDTALRILDHLIDAQADLLGGWGEALPTPHLQFGDRAEFLKGEGETELVVVLRTIAPDEVLVMASDLKTYLADPSLLTLADWPTDEPPA